MDVGDPVVAASSLDGGSFHVTFDRGDRTSEGHQEALLYYMGLAARSLTVAAQ
jgi:hypothetical protein